VLSIFANPIFEFSVFLMSFDDKASGICNNSESQDILLLDSDTFADILNPDIFRKPQQTKQIVIVKLADFGEHLLFPDALGSEEAAR
jgi:hypothetical protein